jgi:hypothetical protein
MYVTGSLVFCVFLVVGVGRKAILSLPFVLGSG